MARLLSVEAKLSQIRVAEMEYKGKTGRVRRSFRFAAPRGAVEDGQIRDTQTIGELLKKELVSNKIKTKKVCFVTDAARIASREVRIPYVKKSRIQSIIEANVGDYFPIDVSKYTLSYNILNVEEDNGEKKYHLMVYAAPRALSAAYRETAAVAGLTMTGLTYTGDSIYQAVKDEFGSGVSIVIKVEERNTGITIVKDGVLALQRTINYGVETAVETVRMYPVFGSDLNRERAMEILCSRNCIRSSFELPPEEYEPEDTDEFVREARREVAESLRYLIGNISRIMDYYVSRNQGTVFEKILCCGIGGEVKGLTALLTQELGQKVEILSSLSNITCPKEEMDGGLSAYIAVVAAGRSEANLIEKAGKDRGKEKKGVSGAVLVLVTGAAAGLVLAGVGIGTRVSRSREQEQLNMRIRQASDIEDTYRDYQNSQMSYGQFLMMYEYTNTPNEGLVEFIEEMERKLPSASVVQNFNSTGTSVSFTIQVAGKAEAAETIMQLRSFDSLSDVTTTGISESEDGTVSMTLNCTYAEPAPLSSR